MKPHFTFLFIFLFLLGFGQSREHDTISRQEKEMREIHKFGKIQRKLIIDNFKGLDYTKLIKLIINDIDFSKLKSENVVFEYSNTCSLIRDYGFGGIYFGKYICDTDYMNPAFNQIDFWTIQTIKTIQKKYHKNLIPYLFRIDNFVIDNTFYNQFDKHLEYYYFDKSKKLIDEVKKESKGILIKKYKIIDSFIKVETADEKIEFYYFPYNKDKLVLITLLGDNQNFDTIFLEFLNKPEKIVVVKFQYNLDEHISKDEGTVYKTYQYQNKKWVEIPTTDEYKF